MQKIPPALLVLLTIPAAFAKGSVDSAAEVTGIHSAGHSAYEAVSLAELRRDPVRRLGKRVRFVVQIRGVLEEWNPYLTRFGPGDWLGIEAWPDEDYTWKKRVFDNPHSRLFVRRGSGAEFALHKAERYRRFEIHGVTREFFLGEPWIEIENAVALESAVDEGTILHVGRAFSLLRDGRVELAIDQLERAKAAPLPVHARMELERHIVECHHLWDEQEHKRTTGARVSEIRRRL